MSLADQITADYENVIFNTDEMAVSVTYEGTAIPALVYYGDKKTGNADAHHAEIHVLRSDVPDPDYRDIVEIDGVTWRVFRDERNATVIGGDHAKWKIPITRAERAVF